MGELSEIDEQKFLSMTSDINLGLGVKLSSSSTFTAARSVTKPRSVTNLGDLGCLLWGAAEIVSEELSALASSRTGDRAGPVRGRTSWLHNVVLMGRADCPLNDLPGIREEQT